MDLLPAGSQSVDYNSSNYSFNTVSSEELLNRPAPAIANNSFVDLNMFNGFGFPSQNNGPSHVEYNGSIASVLGQDETRSPYEQAYEQVSTANPLHRYTQSPSDQQFTGYEMADNRFLHSTTFQESRATQPYEDNDKYNNL
jgi:hypothetical protein